MTFDKLSDEIDLSYDVDIGDGVAPNMHERLTGAVIPYIDFDSFESADARIPNAKKIVKATKSVFGASAVILLADRSGVSVKHNKYKLSLRAYVRGVGYFSCPQAASKFMIEKFKPLLGDCIDDAYKSNQNMGLLFNTKMGDPRILQPLTPKFERIEWSLEQSGYLSRSLIQNVEGETVCLDPENFALPRVSDIIEAIECDAGIDGINEACLKLMPNLTIRKVRNKDGYILIEFNNMP